MSISHSSTISLVSNISFVLCFLWFEMLDRTFFSMRTKKGERIMTANNIVYLPTPDEVEEAKESSRTLSKYANVDRVQLALRGSNGETDDLVLPGHVLQILLDVLSEMSRGNAISLIPRHQEISTQEAANLLNVSRPFLVSLLENNEIPFRKVGTHRRVLLTDVLKYKDNTDKLRSQALDELAALSQEEDMGYGTI